MEMTHCKGAPCPQDSAYTLTHSSTYGVGSIEGTCIQNQGVEVGVVPLTIMPSDVLLVPIIPVSVDLKILVPEWKHLH